MSRQPTQRRLLEGFRQQAETVRTTQIVASEVLGSRNAEAQVAAVAALARATTTLEAAQAAAAAAQGAVDAAAAAGAAVGAATDALNAANAATANANAVIANADARIAQLARSTVVSVVRDGARSPAAGVAWSNDLGLSASGPWGGLLAVVTVEVPITRDAVSDTQYQVGLDLRVNGQSVSRRDSQESPGLMNLSHAFAMPAGSPTVEVFWRAERFGSVLPYNRALSISLFG